MQKTTKTAFYFAAVGVCYNAVIWYVITAPLVCFFFLLVGSVLIITIAADVITSQQNAPTPKEQPPTQKEQPAPQINNPQNVRRSQCGNFEFTPADESEKGAEAWEDVKTKPILTTLKPTKDE